MYNYNEIFKNYRKIKLSKRFHNEHFTYRQIKWYTGLRTSYEYLISEENTRLILCKFTSLIGKIICCLILPIEIIVHGIGNIKELITEYKRMLFQKKYGSFLSDTIWLQSNNIENQFYIDLKDELNKNK